MKNTFYWFILSVLIGANKHGFAQNKGYTLVKKYNGIYVEQFADTIKDPEKYNVNNKIYKTGRQFIYDYYYQNKQQQKYHFGSIEQTVGETDILPYNAWRFIPVDSVDAIKVVEVKLTVIKVGIPDYDQTGIKYDFPMVSSPLAFNESTGVIENEKNIWMHPPRSKFFRILEINPFPFIQQPYQVGNKWNWKLKVDAFWADSRWKIWQSDINNNYQYEITGKKKLKTKLGELDCWVVSAVGTSEIGTTKLISYFNENFGFVKLDYTNIDGTKTVLELKGHLMKPIEQILDWRK